METQEILNNQSNLEKEKWSCRSPAPWLHTILRSYSHPNSVAVCTEQISGLESSPDVKLNACGQLVYDRGGRTIQRRKNDLFGKWCWENWTGTCKKMKLEHFLRPYRKINSKWIKDLNIRSETIKRLEQNISRILFDINHRKIHYDSLLE